MDFDLHALLTALGQLMLGSLYVYAGINHFFVADKVVPLFTARGIPYPYLTLYAGSLFELVCGIGLMLGIAVTAAAFGLVLFTVAASLLMLNFWDMQGEAREATQAVFAQNVAIVGGLLLAAAGSA